MKINKSDITTINKIDLYKIEGLSKQTRDFLVEEADGISSACFIIDQTRTDGTDLSCPYFDATELDNFLVQAEDGDFDEEIAPEILTELKALSQFLSDNKIDEILL